MVQPLDWDVFGTLRSINHGICREGGDCGLLQRIGKKDLAALLMAAWAVVPEAAVLEVWAHFLDE
jgi:hypothetical protein